MLFAPPSSGGRCAVRCCLLISLVVCKLLKMSRACPQRHRASRSCAVRACIRARRGGRESAMGAPDDPARRRARGTGQFLLLGPGRSSTFVGEADRRPPVLDARHPVVEARRAISSGRTPAMRGRGRSRDACAHPHGRGTRADVGLGRVRDAMRASAKETSEPYPRP